MKTFALVAAAGALALGGWSLSGAWQSGSAATGGAATASPAADPAKPVVLELFTSQGCSSCPPADALAEQLARDPSLVVISRPVTYWDGLGWKDTFGQENTALQRSYAARGNKGAGVYTPQIVVDGRDGAVGSNAPQIRALVGAAAQATRPALALARGADGTVAVTVSGRFDGAARLELVALASHRSVRIGEGENGGRSVRYTNVVRGETTLDGSVRSGEVISVSPAQRQTPGADRYALILRQGAQGPILAGRIIG